MDPNESGEMPAVGATDEEVARELARLRRVDVYRTLGVLAMVAGIVGVVVWLVTR